MKQPWSPLVKVLKYLNPLEKAKNLLFVISAILEKLCSKTNRQPDCSQSILP
jgi:hypothetical protein